MSRIGKKLITIPSGVDVTIKKNRVTVKGPKGELSRTFDPTVEIAQEDGSLEVRRSNDERQTRALHGLSRSLLSNMVTGVSEGFTIRLEVIGTGYKAELDGDNLRLALGYSHDVLIVPPPTVKFDVQNRNSLIIITSPNKELIGQVAADIRKLRKPEPYKGKGIKFEGEVVRRKAGKSKV